MYVLAGMKLIIPQKIVYQVLMMTIVVEIGGNNFQLSGDVNLNRESSQESSRKETQDWRSYMIGVSDKESWSPHNNEREEV